MEKIQALMLSVLAYAMAVGVFVVIVAEATLNLTLPILLDQTFGGEAALRHAGLCSRQSLTSFM